MREASSPWTFLPRFPPFTPFSLNAASLPPFFDVVREGDSTPPQVHVVFRFFSLRPFSLFPLPTWPHLPPGRCLRLSSQKMVGIILHAPPFLLPPQKGPFSSSRGEKLFGLPPHKTTKPPPRRILPPLLCGSPFFSQVIFFLYADFLPRNPQLGEGTPCSFSPFPSTS